MTPQSNFTIIAPIVPEEMPALKALLDEMNFPPGTPNACSGTANPDNGIIPFRQFDKLHYARFVILDDPTLGDFDRLCEPVPDYPVSLAFMGDCDGSADDLLIEMAQQAGAGLGQVFSHCEGFEPTKTNLLDWMNQHLVPAAAPYVNHIGRTVADTLLEKTLRTDLLNRLNECSGTPRAIHAQLRSLVPPPPIDTSLGAKLGKLLDVVSVPAAIALAVSLVVLFLIALGVSIVIVALMAIGKSFPFFIAMPALALVAVVLVFLFALRAYEKGEAEIVIRPTDPHVRELAALEDYDVVNQYSVIGSVKLTTFRSVMLKMNLRIIAWLGRHVYRRGFLARIRTIHFARWVFINDNKRVLFASSYDGSLESYNDDFINKGGFGLNFAFGSGIGYPRCRFVLADGAQNEQKFKYTLRRHQIPTQVWYSAYPGLTVYDLARNARVREGLERETMSDDEARAWLADL